MNLQLLNLLEKVYGKHQSVSNGNYYFYSPFVNHTKPKLCIKLQPDSDGNYKWNCWVSEYGGYNIFTLFAKSNVDYRYFEELKSIVSNHRITFKSQPKNNINVKLPFGYKSLTNGINSHKENKLYKYLIDNRKITDLDIIRYNIGYSDVGVYDNMVIIPSYNSDYKLNYYYCRSILDTKSITHKKPDSEPTSIIFEHLLSPTHPIVLCEGMFDSIAIKQNSTPLLGKVISDVTMSYIYDNDIKDIVMCLDPDAMRSTLGYINMLISIGINVYFCELGDKDPSEHGYEEMKVRVQNSKLIKKSDLIKLKVLYGNR